jgi:RimJ/RimL family protein N-acetyltransferase
MSIRLVPLQVDGNADALALELAPGFGGDVAAPRAIIDQTAALHQTHPREQPWGSYLAYVGDTAVGTGAFKWAPDATGSVEIAYMTFPAYEGRGHATQTAGALTELALQAGASEVVAHTLPVENASNRVLRRNGFHFVGEIEDPEDGPVWRWRRT